MLANIDACTELGETPTMIVPRMIRVLCLIAPALSLMACNKQPALTTPSSDQSAFAADYPQRLSEVRTAFTEDEARARTSFATLRALPSTLHDTNVPSTQEVVRQADAAGRSQYYVEEALSHEEMARLFTEDRGALRRRIAGSVAFTAKEKELPKEQADELGNSAAAATERAVDRQLDRRLHARNEATHYIAAHRDALGERNVPTLEQQSDAIARASFVAHVRLELHRRELERLLNEESKVRATLDRTEADASRALGEPGLSKARKADIELRLAATRATRTAMDKELVAARLAVDDMEAKTKALKADYDTLVATLLQDLERKPTATASVAAKPVTAPPAVKAMAPAPVTPTEAETAAAVP